MPPLTYTHILLILSYIQHFLRLTQPILFFKKSPILSNWQKIIYQHPSPCGSVTFQRVNKSYLVRASQQNSIKLSPASTLTLFCLGNSFFPLSVSIEYILKHVLLKSMLRAFLPMTFLKSFHFSPLLPLHIPLQFQLLLSLTWEIHKDGWVQSMMHPE